MLLATLSNNPPGSCESFGGAVGISSRFRVNPPPPTGGTCTAAATANPGALGSTPGRLCVATSTACPASTLCAGTATGVAECVVHDGDVACPGTPFARKIVVGSAATLACTPSCDCAVSATCTGTLTLYESSGCAGRPTPLTADGQCRSSNEGDLFLSYRYIGNVATSACRGTGVSSARIALADTKTVCCR